MKNQTTSQKSRRHFLRGAGVALALPWMESLPLLAQDAAPLAQAAVANKPPLRFACIYFSNGVEPIHWWAKGSGAAMEFGPAAAAADAHPRRLGLPARACTTRPPSSPPARTWAA